MNIYIRTYCLMILSFGSLITSSCSDTKKETITIGTNKNKDSNQNSNTTIDVPVQLDNKGVGPITSVTFDTDINIDMVARGEQVFKSKCVACHKTDKRYIGPAMTGIYKRRSPEWVMNMIMNPTEMVKEDPVAKALFEAYNKTIMLDQNIQESEARAMAEWLRTLN